MKFSILHISDLHRDVDDEIGNDWLLDSLERDSKKWSEAGILPPSICIVSGDLIQGARSGDPNAHIEIERQYRQTEDFLAGVAQLLFAGDHARIVIVPGNHDVSFAAVESCVKRIAVPDEDKAKQQLVRRLQAPNSTLRWSWKDLCFYEIEDLGEYASRFRAFSQAYERFYQGARSYSLDPSEQCDVFDFPDIGVSILGMNSCHQNDVFNQSGEFHPAALIKAGRWALEPSRSGWLIGAVWHHNVSGGPSQTNYVSAEFLQYLIDSGVSLGFHGHQHAAECFDERYMIGSNSRKITIISAGTLCAAPRSLTPGLPRSFNLVEIDRSEFTGKVHQRKMMNLAMATPTWGPGHFDISNSSAIGFSVCPPLSKRFASLDSDLQLAQAEKMIGEGKFRDAVDLLTVLTDFPLAHQLLVEAVERLDDVELMRRSIWPPRTIREAAVLGSSLLRDGNKEYMAEYISCDYVKGCADATIIDLTARIKRQVGQ